MTGASSVEDGCHDADLTRFATVWTRAVAGTSYVPMSRAEIEAYLRTLAERLCAALVAEPFTATPGYGIGADLVAAGFAAPEALARTVTVITTRLPGVLGLGDEVAGQLSALLETLVTGYARGLRRRTLDEQEAIRRAALTAREQAERALRRSEARLQYAALHDPLTGLPNRALFTESLARFLAHWTPGMRAGLCFIGLDGFTAVNDSLGHDIGDQLLVTVADRLTHLAADGGHLVARLDGDEFAMLITGTTCADDAIKVADQAVTALAAPVRVADHDLPISASIGIVERPTIGADPAELMRAADSALHWAKAGGKGKWTVFDPDRSARDVARYRLSAAMPAALDRDEFTLAYQPIVALRDGSLRGVESLAHWHHPSLGLLSHDRFVDLAEDTGLIVRLGLRLLENACRQAAAWQQKSRHAPFISINVGRRQMRHPGLAADVTAVLDRTRLPPHQLQLEITESAVMTSDDATAGALHALADLGVHIAIDEFGTGYGNLATLHELPIHGLKLAGSFARCLRSPAAADPAAENLLATLISLGHALGLTVTADGVETAAQARRLAVLGCDLGQGGYLGLPTTADEIA